MSTTYHLSDNQGTLKQEVVQRPEWLDEQLYPFQSRFVEYTLKNVTKKPKQPYSAQEKRAYRGPMADRTVRRYPHDLFKSAARSHDYFADLEQRLSAIKEMPALLIFGDQDGLLKLGWLARLERIFPRHRSIVMYGCHHFPQVYDTPGVATAIRRWWDEEIEP